MAEQHGGMRRPANPAPVSGPGAMSQRTDGGPAKPTYVAGMPYGEGQDFYDLQSSAPLGAEAAKPRRARGASQGGVPLPTPLFSATQRPDEPVTAGAPFGPGAGPAPAAMPSGPTLTDTLRKVAGSTSDPRIVSLLTVAEQRGW